MGVLQEVVRGMLMRLTQIDVRLTRIEHGLMPDPDPSSDTLAPIPDSLASSFEMLSHAPVSMRLDQVLRCAAEIVPDGIPTTDSVLVALCIGDGVASMILRRFGVESAALVAALEEHFGRSYNLGNIRFDTQLTKKEIPRDLP